MGCISSKSKVVVKPQMTEQQMQVVKDSWALLKEYDDSFEKQGILLFKHLFTIAPELLNKFSFKDERHLYDNDIIKHHGIAFLQQFDHAVFDY